MRKYWTLWTTLGLIVCALTASTAWADVIYVSNHIDNANFDDPLSWEGSDPRWDVAIVGELNSWTETDGMSYYIKDNDAPAESLDAYMVVLTNTTGSARIRQAVDAELNSTDTYRFTIQCRKSPLGSAVPPVPMYVEVYDGTTYTTVATIAESSFGADWNEEAVSFQWAGDTIAADGWSIAFRVDNTAGELDGVNIDTIDVPEPATLSLLAVGGVMVLLRRRRR